MEATGSCVLEGYKYIGAACFHPRKTSIVLCNDEQLFEIDALSGAHLWSAPLGSALHGDVRLITFLESKSGSLNFVVAFQHGDIQVWDSESLQIRDHIVPSKKDEGRPVTCWACANIGGDPFAFISRGSNGLERISLSSRRGSKSLKADGKWKATCVAFSNQLVVAGSDCGDLRFLDPKSLNSVYTFCPSTDSKSQHQGLNSILRTSVVSLSFCRQHPHLLVSSFQKGGLAIWNLESSLLDDAVITGTGILVDAKFHPWFPTILTLSNKGEMTAWDIGIDVSTKHAKLCRSSILKQFNFNRIEQEYRRIALPYRPPRTPALYSSLLLHGAYNLCMPLTSKPENNDFIGHGNCKLIYAFVDQVCPYSLLPTSSVSCPHNLLRKENGSSNISDDWNEDLVYFIRSNKLACINVCQPDVSPRTVASVPALDSDGKIMRPLHLTRSHRYPLAAIAVQVSINGSASNSGISVYNAGTWKILLLDICGKECESQDVDVDDENEGRELFFLGIGATSKPRVGRLTAPHGMSDRSNSGVKQDEKWSCLVGGRDALFSGDRLMLVSENGCSISILQLPQSPDTAHVASWQKRMTDMDQSLVVIKLPILKLPAPIRRIFTRFPESDADLFSSDQAGYDAQKSNWTFICYCNEDRTSSSQGCEKLDLNDSRINRYSCILRGGITTTVPNVRSDGCDVESPVWFDTSQCLELHRQTTSTFGKNREQVPVIEVAWRRDGAYGAILTRRAAFLVDTSLNIVARWIQPCADELQSIIWAGLGVLISTSSHIWVLGLDGTTAVVASLFPWGTGCRLCAVNSDVLVYLSGPGGPGSRPIPVVRSIGLIEPLIHGILSETRCKQNVSSTNSLTTEDNQKTALEFKDAFISADPRSEAADPDSSLATAVSRGNRSKVSTGLLCRVAASGPRSISIMERVWGVGGSGLGWLSWKGQYSVAWSGQNWRACLVLLLNRPLPPEGPVHTNEHFCRLAIAAHAAQDIATAIAAMWAAGEDQALVQLVANSCDMHRISGEYTVSGEASEARGYREIHRVVSKFLASHSPNPWLQTPFSSLCRISSGNEPPQPWPCSVPARARYLSQDLIRRGFKAGTLPPMMASEDLENSDQFARSGDLSEWIGAATSFARDASGGNTTASPAASSYGSESRGSHSIASKAGSRDGSTTASGENGRAGRTQRAAVGSGGTGSLWFAESTSAASHADVVQGEGGDGPADGWLSANAKDSVVEGGERGSTTESTRRGVEDDDDDWGDGGREVEAKTKIQLVIKSAEESAASATSTADLKSFASALRLPDLQTQPSRSRSGRQRAVVGANSSAPCAVELQRSPALAAIKECSTPVAGGWSDLAAADPFLAIATKSDYSQNVQPPLTQVPNQVGFTVESSIAASLPNTNAIEPGGVNESFGWATFDALASGENWFSSGNSGTPDTFSGEMGWSVETSEKHDRAANMKSLDPGIEKRSEHCEVGEHGHFGMDASVNKETPRLAEPDFADFQSSGFGFGGNETAGSDGGFGRNFGDFMCDFGFGKFAVEQSYDARFEKSGGMDLGADAACRFDTDSKRMSGMEDGFADTRRFSNSVDITPGLENMDLRADSCPYSSPSTSCGDYGALARDCEMVLGEPDLNDRLAPDGSGKEAGGGMLKSPQTNFDLFEKRQSPKLSDECIQGELEARKSDREAETAVDGKGGSKTGPRLMNDDHDEKRSETYTSQSEQDDLQQVLAQNAADTHVSKTALSIVHLGQSSGLISEHLSQRSAEISPSPLVSVIHQFTVNNSAEDSLAVDAYRQHNEASAHSTSIKADGAADKVDSPIIANGETSEDIISPDIGVAVLKDSDLNAASEAESASSSGELSSTPSCSSSPTCSPAATPDQNRSSVALREQIPGPVLGLGPIFSSSYTTGPALSPPPTPSPPPKDAPRKIPGRPFVSPGSAARRTSGRATSISKKDTGIGAAEVRSEDPLTHCIISGVAASRTRSIHSGPTPFVIATFAPSPAFPSSAPLCPVLRVPAEDVKSRSPESPGSAGSQLAVSGHASPCFSGNDSLSHASSRSLGDLDFEGDSSRDNEAKVRNEDECVPFSPNTDIVAQEPLPLSAVKTAKGCCGIDGQDDANGHVSDSEGDVDDGVGLVAFEPPTCEEASTRGRHVRGLSNPEALAQIAVSCLESEQGNHISDLPKLNRVAPPRLDLSSIQATKPLRPSSGETTVPFKAEAERDDCHSSESGGEEQSTDSFDLFGPFKSTPCKAVADGDSEAEAVNAQELTDSDEPEEDGRGSGGSPCGEVVRSSSLLTQASDLTHGMNSGQDTSNLPSLHCRDRQMRLPASSTLSPRHPEMREQPDMKTSEKSKSDKSHRRLGSWAGPVWQASSSAQAPEGDG